MRNKVLTALAVVAMSAGPAFASCGDLVADVEALIASGTLSGADLVNAEQMLDIGAGQCDAGNEEAATAALNAALAVAGG